VPYPCILGEKNFYGLMDDNDCTSLDKLSSSPGDWVGDGYARWFNTERQLPQEDRFALPCKRSISFS